MKHTFLIFIFSLFLFSCNIGKDPVVEAEEFETILQNVSYGLDEKQKFDLYLPVGRDTIDTKLIILIHGGGWSGGDKSNMHPFVDKLHRRWPEAAIANVNYRLANGSEIIHTDITDDLKAVVQLFVDSAGVYNFSTSFAMMGASAGAHLSALYAYQYNDGDYIKAVSNLFGPSYFADSSFYASNNLLLGGPVKEVYKKYVGEYWNTNLYESLSPYHIVNEQNYKPTISFHGKIDMVVPVEHNRMFATKLEVLGLPFEYFEYASQNHGFNDKYNNQVCDETVVFFKENM